MEIAEAQPTSRCTLMFIMNVWQRYVEYIVKREFPEL